MFLVVPNQYFTSASPRAQIVHSNFRERELSGKGLRILRGGGGVLGLTGGLSTTINISCVCGREREGWWQHFLTEVY